MCVASVPICPTLWTPYTDHMQLPPGDVLRKRERREIAGAFRRRRPKLDRRKPLSH